MPPKKRHPWQKPWKPGKKQTPVKAPQRTKARRVFVTLELETDAPLAWLRDSRTWSCKDMRNDSVRHCIQAQANIAQT